MKKNKQIRFAVICNGTSFPAWQAKCIKKILELDFVDLSLLIIDDEYNPWDNLQKAKNIKRLFWHIFVFMGRFFSKARKSINMEIELKDIPVLHCKVTKKGKFSQYFSKDDIETIKHYDLDFIIRFGFNIIRGKILEVPRYGIWSFHHDDEEKYRGAPPCFWEIYHNDPVTGAILQRLNNELDGGVILKKGFFKTISTSYFRNRSFIFLESAEWPAQVCVDIMNDCADYLNNPPTRTSAPIYYPPNNFQMILFGLKLAKNFFYRVFNFFLYFDIWNIGIIDCPIESFLHSNKTRQVKWLPESAQKNTFKADPFFLHFCGKDYILFEDYDYFSQGRISSLSLDTELNVISTEVIMQEDFHMSYPYVFEHNNKLYCIPETGEAGSVNLYSPDAVTGSWRKVKTIIENFPGIDSTVFYYKDSWWLWATDQDDGQGHKLRLWYADEVQGPWIPHPANPVKIDVCSSRPAGAPLVIGNKLFRPAQDCSRTYGGSIVINEVAELSRTVYREIKTSELKPDMKGDYPDGMHTITAFGNRTIIDGKRRVLIFKKPSLLFAKFKKIKNHLLPCAK